MFTLNSLIVISISCLVRISTQHHHTFTFRLHQHFWCLFFTMRNFFLFFSLVVAQFAFPFIFLPLNLVQSQAAVNSKLIMDDIDVEANPDYLSVNHSIDRSNEHENEPIANIQIDLKKDITDLKVRVALNAEIGGKLNEIYPSKDYNPCKDDVEDELVKYALDSLEKYGNLKIQCPLKQVKYFHSLFLLNFKQ